MQCSSNSNISCNITFSPLHILAGRCKTQKGESSPKGKWEGRKVEVERWKRENEAITLHRGVWWGWAVVCSRLTAGSDGWETETTAAMWSHSLLKSLFEHLTHHETKTNCRQTHVQAVLKRITPPSPSHTQTHKTHVVVSVSFPVRLALLSARLES